MARVRPIEESDQERTSRIISDLDPDQVVDGIEALIKRVDWHVPVQFYLKDVKADDWPWAAVGMALITRMRDTMESMALLVATRRESDSLVLLRVLYEHVVTFCWLAIDPKAHLDEWWDDAQFWRLKLANDAATFDVKDVMTDDEMREAEKADKMIPVANRALQVDAYWSDRIRGFRGPKQLLGMRGLYTVLFRRASETAHATARTVELVIEDPPPPRRPPFYRVAKEQSDNLIWPALSVPVFCHALLVCEKQFGWPDADMVRAINDGLLGEASLLDVPSRPERHR